MKRLFADMNPTLRGFLLLVLVTAAIVALRLESSLSVLLIVLRILFIVAIAFFVYLLWRERRDDIAVWPTRARVAFYGGALLIVVAIGAFILDRPAGLPALAFVLIVGISGFAMWRAWRDQHTYG